jgi:hypothetical protein
LSITCAHTTTELDTSPDSEDRAVHGGNSYDPGLESHGHNLDEFSDINVTKLLAKIDLRLIPSLSIMVSMSTERPADTLSC